MINKTIVSNQLKQLPENFTIDELVERLIFIQKVENGLKNSRENNVVSEDELEKEMKEWFK